MGIVINCNCTTENVQKPFDLSWNSCIFNICQLFSIDLPISAINIICYNDVIDGLSLVLKFKTTARETNMFRDPDRDTFVSLMIHTRNCLRPSNWRLGPWKLILKDTKKCSKKSDCGRSASFPHSSPLGKKFLTIIYYWILEYLESINFSLPLDKMTLNKAVH